MYSDNIYLKEDVTGFNDGNALFY